MPPHFGLVPLTSFSLATALHVTRAEFGLKVKFNVIFALRGNVQQFLKTKSLQNLILQIIRKLKTAKICYIVPFFKFLGWTAVTHTKTKIILALCFWGGHTHCAIRLGGTLLQLLTER